MLDSWLRAGDTQGGSRQSAVKCAVCSVQCAVVFFSLQCALCSVICAVSTFSLFSLCSFPCIGGGRGGVCLLSLAISGHSVMWSSRE